MLKICLGRICEPTLPLSRSISNTGRKKKLSKIEISTKNKTLRERKIPCFYSSYQSIAGKID